ncbi:MAG: hypothetical protein E7L31_18320 [Aeromonas sp.]|nr:hypothetical protein [Aeromonas caviae]MDH1848020.1 hypothetical protein [Aeromonas caviae]MDU7313305.1 hypothetical protein [Aeromonas sp.]
MKICPYCGKQGLDFDRATDGVECKRPVVYSPAVGDWGCVFSVEDRLEEDGDMGNNSTQPSVEEAIALDCKAGRKFGAAVRIEANADSKELALALSRQQAEVVMQNANSRVFVTVKNVGEGE